jgi:hypothetical protein
LKWKTTKSGGDGSKALSDTVCKKASKGVSGPARRERKRGRAVEMALGIEGWRIQKKRSVPDLGAFWIFPWINSSREKFVTIEILKGTLMKANQACIPIPITIPA